MMRSGEVKVAAIQPGCDMADKGARLDRALALIDRAAKAHAEIALLPELFTLPYSAFMKKTTELFREAESVPGPTIDRISEDAKQHEMFVIAPIFEVHGLGKYYSNAVVIGPDGKVLTTYYKVHIPCRHGSEKFYFRPGPLRPAVDIGQFGIGVAVCYDAFYPEMCRLLTLSGASVIFVPAAAMWDKEKWKTLLMTRALENGSYVVAANRAGKEGGINCFGTSLIVGPGGDIIAEATESDEEVITATLHHEAVERTRNEWAFLRDMRSEVFTALCKYID
jgi:N-carbamoylputrescine amidase